MLSSNVEGFLLVLLIVDVFIVMIESFMASEFPMCNIIRRDAISCCPSCQNNSTGPPQIHKCCLLPLPATSSCRRVPSAEI